MLTEAGSGPEVAPTRARNALQGSAQRLWRIRSPTPTRACCWEHASSTGTA
jgi:hypothetical protein